MHINYTRDNAYFFLRFPWNVSVADKKHTKSKSAATS